MGSLCTSPYRRVVPLPQESEVLVEGDQEMNRRGKSGFYKEFLAERDEILRHKDVESEKVGCDVGFECALLDWIEKHRSAWREGRLQQQGFRPGFRET